MILGSVSHLKPPAVASVNERQLIRAQLSGERIRAGAVARAVAAAAGERARHTAFIAAAVDYLAWVLSAFEERDQRLAECLPTDAAVQAALALPGQSRQTLTQLEAALSAPAALAAEHWRAFSEDFDEAWAARRERIEALLESHAAISLWRAVSGIDADTIMTERRRYAQLEALRPASIALPPAVPA
jgi:hypothetical protein